MKCEYFRELISAGLDGELKKDEKPALAEHMRECSECKAFAAELKEIELLSGDHEPLTMPGDLEKRILKHTVLQKKKRRSITDIFKGYYRVPRGVAWISLIVIIGLAINSIFYPLEKPAAKATISIQPAENVLTVQKIIISEKDIVSSSSIKKSKNPI